MTLTSTLTWARSGVRSLQGRAQRRASVRVGAGGGGPPWPTCKGRKIIFMLPLPPLYPLSHVVPCSPAPHYHPCVASLDAYLPMGSVCPVCPVLPVLPVCPVSLVCPVCPVCPGYGVSPPSAPSKKPKKSKRVRHCGGSYLAYVCHVSPPPVVPPGASPSSRRL